MIICDPPSGWKYGFPKEYDFEPSRPIKHMNKVEIEEEVNQWYRDNGYPQHEISIGMLKYVRFWESE